MATFGARDVSGASFVDGIYDVFCTCLNFYIKKCNIKNNQKITQKSISSWCLAFCWFHPCPKQAPPKGHFWRYLRCFMHIKHSSKISRFCASGGGSAARSAPPIANPAMHKASDAGHIEPHGMRRCLSFSYRGSAGSTKTAHFWRALDVHKTSQIPSKMALGRG